MRCRVVRSGRASHFTDKRHGYLSPPTDFLLSFLLSFSLPLVSGWSGLPKRAFTPAVSFEPPRRLLLSVQANQLFFSVCSEVGRTTHFIHPTRFHCLTFLPPSTAPLERLESFCFARSESNSFGIGRTDLPSTSSVSASLRTIPLSTTFLSGPYHDVTVTYPTAGDKCSTQQSSQRRDFTDWVPHSTSTS